MTKARFRITVKNGRKIVEDHYVGDYNQAMSLLDMLEEQYYGKYTVEFKDTDPFRK